MKIQFILFIVFTISSIFSSAQEINVPESLKTISNSKCYWGYSVQRLTSKNNNTFKYSIRVSIIEQDSNGKYGSLLKLKSALIYCVFAENETERRVKFKRRGKYWVAKFNIHTAESLPLEIIANYNDQDRIMPLTLNRGTYPGERDN